MIYFKFRRKGIGCLLMEVVENRVEKENRLWFVFDIREGGLFNYLYSFLGFIEVGCIFYYVELVNGDLYIIVFYYKFFNLSKNI